MKNIDNLMALGLRPILSRNRTFCEDAFLDNTWGLLFIFDKRDFNGLLNAD